MTLLNVLVGFARTGRVGPLHCGMPLTAAEDLLGPGRPHPAHIMKGSGIDGCPYSWNGLRLVVTQRAVSGIRIDLRPGSTVGLPPLVLPGSESFEATVLRTADPWADRVAGAPWHSAASAPGPAPDASRPYSSITVTESAKKLVT
ncbi:hypothetical protein [Streptomyces sp. NPDC058751]|uniref:hypothetical protein n=1 Tax=Streptomyces sp. NPDC058751 TaxID=3346623 RepID=UPI0036CE3646